MTFDYGTADTSGGRWGTATKHAVKPGTERKVGRLGGKRATSLCGVPVYPFTGAAFKADDDHACKKCKRAIAKEVKA